MEVILQQDLDELGLEGDIVKVAKGYARNYLIPKGIAMEAISQNIKAVEQRRKKIEVNNVDILDNPGAVSFYRSEGYQLNQGDVIVTNSEDMGSPDQRYWILDYYDFNQYNSNTQEYDVFDGEKGNYSEADATSPTNEYARSKILAEKIVLDLGNSIVIRTEPLYGFNNQINRLMAGTATFENDFENGYPETLRDPVYVNDLPRIILSLIEKDQTGVFHIAGQGKMKWIDFLRKLASLEDAEDKVIIVDNSGWILEPPHDSSLATSKIESLGIKTTSFETALKELRKHNY